MIWSALNISIFICKINQFKYIQFISITIYWVPAIVELWSNWSKGKRLQMKQEDTDKQANNPVENWTRKLFQGLMCISNWKQSMCFSVFGLL